MPQHTFISTGSNTRVKEGEGTVYGAVVGPANGGSVFFVDSTSIGVTPNYVTQLSNSSNIAMAYPLTTAWQQVNMFGARFQDGLVVAATSNAAVTVFYD